MQALILAGGSGTRFWPLSRRLRPKQLLALEGDESLLRATMRRLEPLVPASSVWICTTSALADAVRRDVPEVPPEQILVEPEGRNTAPAIGWSVSSMPAAARRGAIAVLPADHRIGEPDRFLAVLDQARHAAEAEDRVMTLGVTPRWAETGYGYLELADGEAAAEGSPASAATAPAAAAADRSNGLRGIRQVRRFVEKPSEADARRYLESGRYLWNAGIFVFRGETFLDLLARHEPETARGLAAIAAEPQRLQEIYRQLPPRSVDYAVMEKLDAIWTLPLDCGWSDLGSWEALAELLPADDEADGSAGKAGNAHNTGRGDRLAIEARRNLLFADQGTIAVLGVDDLVVVRTADTVLVIPRSRSQEVRRLVQELDRRGRGELL